MGLFDFGHDIISVHVYTEGWEVYKRLNSYQKHNIKILLLEKLYEITHDELVKQEIEYEKENEVRDRNSHPRPARSIFFYVHYPVAVTYRRLDKNSKIKIMLAVLDKLYEISNDEDLLKRIKKVKRKFEKNSTLINPSADNNK
jgi:hypothetical protein